MWTRPMIPYTGIRKGVIVDAAAARGVEVDLGRQHSLQTRPLASLPLEPDMCPGVRLVR
jgi:hypothetical protein